MKKTALYASAGPFLTHYDVDVDGLALVKRQSIKLAYNIQYIWPHASRPLMYAATSRRVSRDVVGTDHNLTTLGIDPTTGKLELHGDPVQLSNRPIHLSTDPDSRNLLVAFNGPAELQIYRLETDGSIGKRVPQSMGLDTGVFPHQIRVTRDSQMAVLVTRGNPYRGGHAHLTDQPEPGALKVFQYNAGTLAQEPPVAPGGGVRFGSRHLDFHPTAPWIYVSLETQNQLFVFRREGSRILPDPLFIRELLPDPHNTSTHQGAGTIHLHPNGKFVYCVNRGHVPTDYQGKKVLIGVDNSIVVFAIDQGTGEPTEIQRIDAGGIAPRTFTLDPSGRMLVAANSEAHWIKQGDGVRMVPANLSVFRINDDGRLSFVRKYDVESSAHDKMFWAGIVEY